MWTVLDKQWSVFGTDIGFCDSDMDSIGDRIPTPDEMECVNNIIAATYLNDRDEVSIQSSLVDFNTHSNPEELRQQA